MSFPPIGTKGEGLVVRSDIVRFMRALEVKMSENDHKGGYERMPANYLMNRLLEEYKELGAAVVNGEPDVNVIEECLDVAAFALMIAMNTWRGPVSVGSKNEARIQELGLGGGI